MSVIFYTHGIVEKYNSRGSLFYRGPVIVIYIIKSLHENAGDRIYTLHGHIRPQHSRSFDYVQTEFV